MRLKLNRHVANGMRVVALGATAFAVLIFLAVMFVTVRDGSP